MLVEQVFSANGRTAAKQPVTPTVITVLKYKTLPVAPTG